MLTATEHNAVLKISLAKPPLNTLDLEIMGEFSRRFAEVAARPAGQRPRVIVLTSEVPKVFSHGVDPEAFLAAGAAERKGIFVELFRMIENVLRCPVPVVADISGGAFAGGAVISVLADTSVIGRNHGRISFSEVKVGMPIPTPILALLQKQVNPAAITEALLLGANFSADEAVQHGFCQRAYSNEAERDALLKEYCGKFLRLAPEVVGQTLKTIRGPVLAVCQQFSANFDREMLPFLGDDFLGKGLLAVVKGERPAF